MARRSNRTRGTKRDNLGRSLKAMKMKPLANAVRGGLGIEESIKYTFDGSTMYATIPGWDCLGDETVYSDVSYQATNDEGYVIGAARPITEIGRVGANYHDGAVWGVRLPDNSPIQDTTACFGNGTRYVELENPIVLEGDFEIEFDWIRQDASGTTTAILSDTGATSTGTVQLHNLGVSSNRIQFVDDDGGATAVINLTDNIAIGQHFHVKARRVGTDIFASVDGGPELSVPAAGGAEGAITIGQFAKLRDRATEIMSANSALQNVIIRDLTNNLTWEYNLDEGSGTAANNTGTAQGNYLNQPLWDRATLDGNDARYIEIPAFNIGASDDFRVTFGAISTATDNKRYMGDDDGSCRVYRNVTSGWIISLNSTVYASGLGNDNDVSVGEHQTVVFERIGGNITGYLNGVAGPPTNALNGVADSITELYRGGVNGIEAGGALGNVQLENLTTGEYVEYRIDEGSGTTVKAYDRAGNVIPALGSERVTDGTFGEGGANWIEVTGSPVDYTYGNNACAMQRNGGGVPILRQVVDTPFPTGTRLLLEYEIFAGSDFNHSFKLGGVAIVPTSAATVGVHQVEYTVPSTASQIEITSEGSLSSTLVIGNISIKQLFSGTITPDAAWTQQPEYSNDGEWTPDTDWQFIPDNSRTYPMNQAADRHKPGYFACFDGNGDRLESADATIVNYDPDSWQYLP